MTQTRLTTLAALLMAALLLAGCGGGGGGGGEPTVTQTVHDELQAELDAALANLTKEREAKAAAEEARAAADAARMAADEARATAETERDTAEAAKATAEAAQTAAETARQAAADAQATAEAERDTAQAAETAAKAAEMTAKAAQATAVADRDTAKAAETAAKAAEMVAKAVQAEAKAAETAALAAKATAEAEALAAKAARDTAETDRDRALAAKAAVEADRDEKRDAATAAQVELINVKAARDSAQAKVTELTGDLEDANVEVTRLTGELETANDNVDDLTDRIGTADDADSLTGMLDAANDKVERLTGEVTTAQGEVADLKARVGTTSDASSLTGMLEDAKVEVTRIQGLLDTANAEVTRLTNQIGTASDADSLQGMLEAEKQKVSRLENQARILNDTITGLRSQLADARADVTDAEREAEQAKREADQRVAEVKTQADASTRVGPLLMALEVDALPPGNDQVPRPSYKRGGKLKFEPTGGYTRGSNAPSISGWTSYSFSDLRGALGTDTFYLYTNIKTAGTKAFWKLYGPSIDSVAGDDVKAKPDSFGSNRSLYRNNAGAPEAKNDASHGGTYDGVRGTFKCANSCNMDADTGGVITISAGWSFKPTGRPTSGVNLGHDSEYLYFGIWAFAPKEAGSSTVSPEFKWIAGGGAAAGDCATGATCAEALDNTHLRALKDTGRFTGGAVGRYAVKAQLGQNAKIGTFTADAAFTANFDTESEIGTIKGRIVNFRENGQSLANWNVALGSGEGAATAVVLNTGAVMSGVTSASIGGLTADGDWAAYLHGSNNPGYDEFDADDICPVSAGCLSADLAGLVGWFNASTTGDTAALAGAFGAEYKP